MRRNITGTVKLGQDSLGKGLSEFNAPLIEGVDVPDGALSEDLHLVDSNENSKHLGGKLLEQKGVGWAVSLEDLVRNKGRNLVGGHLSLKLSGNSLSALSESKGLSLGKEVGHKDGVVVSRSSNVLGEIVLGRDGGQEIARDGLSSLVDELVESVLSVGSGLSPDYGAGLDLCSLSFLGDVLSVGLHVSLLEVGSEAVHVLVVGEDGNGLGLVEIVVPQADQAERHGQVLGALSIEKVLINGVGTGVHFHPVVETDGKGDGGSDGGPERVTATNPVPKAEHVVDVNTEGRDGFGVGGEGSKVLGNGGAVALEVVKDPLLCGAGVCHSLLGGEGLGSDEEEGGLGVAFLEDLGHVGAVNVGAEVHVQIALGVRLEGFADHDRSKVGPSDADVDDVLDRLTGLSLPDSVANVLGELLDLGKGFVYVGHDVLTIDDYGGVGLVAKGNVQNRAALGGIDLLP